MRKQHYNPQRRERNHPGKKLKTAAPAEGAKIHLKDFAHTVVICNRGDDVEAIRKQYTRLMNTRGPQVEKVELKPAEIENALDRNEIKKLIQNHSPS